MPAFPSLHRAEGPVEQITHVGEDLDGLPATTIEGGEGFGRVLEGSGSAICKSSKSMAKKLALVVHAANIAQAEQV